MSQRSNEFLVIACTLLSLTGCGSSSPSRFYTLDSTAKPDGNSLAGYAILIEPISIPAAVDRPQFVIKTAPNRVELEEFNRWASPLDDGIARAVAGNLTMLLGTPRVATVLGQDFTANYFVSIDVQRFDSMPGEAVILEAFWAVRNPGRGETHSGRSVAREAVAGKDFDALAAAHSLAIGKLSSDIAAAIREDAAKKP